jgi:hypothetical protein
MFADFVSGGAPIVSAAMAAAETRSNEPIARIAPLMVASFSPPGGSNRRGFQCRDGRPLAEAWRRLLRTEEIL